jgi:enhancing lycopene biosynthesis protein 2
MTPPTLTQEIIMPTSPKVAVVLSGCGVFDGSEIHEAVACLIALDRRGAHIICTAPSIPQSTVMNHATKEPAKDQSRNVLEESARIARGKIRDVATLHASELDALVFPGGFGAAKNLSDFASKGPACTLNQDVHRLVSDMHAAKKPIGLACIAPVLAAKILSKHAPRLTIGADKPTADAINSMGAQHVPTDPTGVVVDEQNRLVTTPCYMNDVGPWTVFQGVEKMIEQVLRLAQAR